MDDDVYEIKLKHRNEFLAIEEGEMCARAKLLEQRKIGRVDALVILSGLFQ